jgi:catechol 2,3-dioxygenase
MKSPIHPKTTIGHIHLKVANLERAEKFYTQVLGFEVTTRMGSGAVFVSAGGYHHHIGLNTWESKGGSAPPPSCTGLFHFAILMPTRVEFARMIKRLSDHQWPIDGAADHGVSEAIYLQDPDGNGIEIYVDRPRDQWPLDSKGQLTMYTHALNLESVLKELEK